MRSVGGRPLGLGPVAITVVSLALVVGVPLFLFSRCQLRSTQVVDVPGVYEGHGPAYDSVTLILKSDGTYAQTVRDQADNSIETTGAWNMIPAGASSGRLLMLHTAWEPDQGATEQAGALESRWERADWTLDMYYTPDGPFLESGVDATTQLFRK